MTEPGTDVAGEALIGELESLVVGFHHGSVTREAVQEFLQHRAVPVMLPVFWTGRQASASIMIAVLYEWTGSPDHAVDFYARALEGDCPGFR